MWDVNCQSTRAAINIYRSTGASFPGVDLVESEDGYSPHFTTKVINRMCVH
jgi:hypothetical protein